VAINASQWLSPAECPPVKNRDAFSCTLLLRQMPTSTRHQFCSARRRKRIGALAHVECVVVHPEVLHRPFWVVANPNFSFQLVLRKPGQSRAMSDGKDGSRGVLGNVFSISYTKPRPCGCFKSHQPPQNQSSVKNPPPTARETFVPV
jgi:hypothetical protein